MRRRLVLLLLTVSGGIARADEPPKPPAAPAAPAPAPSPTPAARPAPPPTPEQAADAVLAATKSKDDAALKVLAASDDPDPWSVADALIQRAEFDTAESFAKAAPRVDVEKLPAYVASRRGKPDDAARRARLLAANAALMAGKVADAIESLGPQESGAVDDVVGIRLAMGRGIALRALVKLDASAAAFLAAGEASERLGWLARAASAFREAGASAYGGSAFVAARSAWERALSVCERRADKAGAAGMLSNIGGVCFALGDFAKALSIFERTVSTKEAMGDKAGAAAALGNVGAVYTSLKDYPKALSTQERALAAMEALGDKVGAAKTLGNIGLVYKALGDYPKALSTLERALAAKEALGDKAGAVGTLVNIGNVHHELGDFAKALSMLERALAAMEAMGNRAGVAAAMSSIGTVCFSRSDYAKALAMHQRALAAYEALGDRVGAAKTLGNIGIVYRALGDYAKALSMLERALSAKEAMGDRAGAALMLVVAGGVYYSLRDNVKALARYERALAAMEAMGDKAGAAKALLGIGTVHFSVADYAKALATFERVLAAMEALGDGSGMATTLGNIGNVYASSGDYAKAIATYERALAMQEAQAALGDKMALADKAGPVRTLTNIGTICVKLGDHAKAIQSFERAAGIAEKLGANELVVRALTGLAFARLHSGDDGHAMELAHRAVVLLKSLVGGLGEEQGATAREQFTSLFSIGLTAAANAGNVAEGAFFLESGRAGSLLEALESRGALRAALLPEELRVADVEARGREARALVAYTKSLDGGDLAAIRARDAELNAARADVVEVVDRIQRESKRAAEVVYPEASKLTDMQGFLAAGEAFVLYGLSEGEGDAYALVLTKGAARIVALGKSSQIATACEALDASDPSSDPTAALDRVRDLVVKPLALPKETKRLLVSPEGPLSYVPFSALLPGMDIACEPSGTTYGVLLEERSKRGSEVLALGDPDYTAKFNPTALEIYAPAAVAVVGPTRGARLVPLPGTRIEATAVGDVTLFGKDASEVGLREALSKKKARWHAVHFACHGLVNPDRPTRSSLALTPDAENDGFLTALEILRMEIPSDLVVMSACETSKGKIVGGEGIVGLTRAVMYAGSPRVICSLWKVDDDATRALMTKFYELWNPKDGKSGLPTAEALRRAQEFVKAQEKWKHPYFWAAWVLWGLPE